MELGVSSEEFVSLHDVSFFHTSLNRPFEEVGNFDLQYGTGNPISRKQHIYIDTIEINSRIKGGR